MSENHMAVARAPRPLVSPLGTAMHISDSGCGLMLHRPRQVARSQTAPHQHLPRPFSRGFPGPIRECPFREVIRNSRMVRTRL